jgi:hypothetical protein
MKRFGFGIALSVVILVLIGVVFITKPPDPTPDTKAEETSWVDATGKLLWRERLVVRGMIVDLGYPCQTIATLRRSTIVRRGPDQFSLGFGNYDWMVTCDHGETYHVQGTEAYYRQDPNLMYPYWAVTPEPPHH